MSKKYSNGTRYCPDCGTKLEKWGKINGKHQRWYCKQCKHTIDLGKERRKKAKKIKAVKYLIKYALSQRCKTDFGLSYFKITKLINLVIDKDYSIPRDPGPYNVLYLDGMRFKGFCALITRDNEDAIGFDFVDSEKSSTRINFLSKFAPPKYVVCDGQKGLLRALKLVWPCTKVQRCLFHIWNNIRQKLTLNPETDAGIELLKIGKDLLKIKTVGEKEQWLNNYRDWSLKYNDFILERSINPRTGEVGWKHEKIKSVVYNLDKLIMNNSLFMFLKTNFVSPFNNLLEGGINSPIRNLIGSHRGATIKLRQVIISCYLLKRSKHWKAVTNKLYKKKK